MQRMSSKINYAQLLISKWTLVKLFEWHVCNDIIITCHIVESVNVDCHR